MAARVIKKYPNRRLYDTEISSYITIEDVRQLKEAPPPPPMFRFMFRNLNCFRRSSASVVPR